MSILVFFFPKVNSTFQKWTKKMSKIEFLKLLWAKKYEKYAYDHNALATEKSQIILLL